MTNSTVPRVLQQFEGVTAWKIRGRDLPADPPGHRCICCADGTHIYSHDLKFPKAPSQDYPGGPYLDEYIYQAVRDVPEGSTLRITVEVVAEGPGESATDNHRRSTIAERARRAAAGISSAL